MSCGLDPADLGSSLMKGWPGKGGDITANVAWARRVAQACARDGGDVLRGMSTRTEARDIDSLRAALGEPKLSYWGVSYGTYVGAVYATMFPRRTDRVVLDSNDDPDHRRYSDVTPPRLRQRLPDGVGSRQASAGGRPPCRGGSAGA
ncbi:alpha/beta fold hydrolase [Nonomuraea sp. B12E4]|uniref:alpha/beta fold hydrolase n=1 Tax=Nonomuraea sp. B12E4 TaxID=3153564 RepID=UPI00325D2DE4